MYVVAYESNSGQERDEASITLILNGGHRRKKPRERLRAHRHHHPHHNAFLLNAEGEHRQKLLLCWENGRQVFSV